VSTGRQPSRDTLVLTSVVAAMAVVPLVVYLRVIPLGSDVFPFWNGQRENYDFFSFYKARVIVGLAVAALAGLTAAHVRGQRDLRPLPRPAAVALACYACLAVASAWASPFPWVVLDGFCDRYEGLLVLLSYVVLAVASFVAFTSARRAQSAALWLACSSCVIGIIGLFQLAGLDPFQTAWGRSLILPAAFQQLGPTLQFPVEARSVYATLYHYNYVGSYTALVLPFLLVVMTSDGLTKRARVTVGIGAALMALIWVACGSRAGLMGGAVALAATVVTLRRRLWEYRLAVAVAGVVVLAAVVAAGVLAGGRFQQRARSVIGDVSAAFTNTAPSASALPLELARIDGSTAHLRVAREPLDVHHRAGTLDVFSGGEGPLPLIVDAQTGRVRIDDPRFAEISLTLGHLNGRPAFVVSREKYVLNFLLLESGIELAMKTGRPVPAGGVETFGFAGREQMGSARGFIWSRSLPLLTHTRALGYGPDAFALVFPQQDFPGKYRAYGTTDMLVDKAHNLFLQCALNTGVLSALALLALFAWYVVTSARVYWGRRVSDATGTMGAACFAGVVGYLVAGLFNDSTVAVAPVFWTILGLGIRMNVDLARPAPPETRRAEAARASS